MHGAVNTNRTAKYARHCEGGCGGAFSGGVYCISMVVGAEECGPPTTLQNVHGAIARVDSKGEVRRQRKGSWGVCRAWRSGVLMSDPSLRRE